MNYILIITRVLLDDILMSNRDPYHYGFVVDLHQ